MHVYCISQYPFTLFRRQQRSNEFFLDLLFVTLHADLEGQSVGCLVQSLGRQVQH